MSVHYNLDTPPVVIRSSRWKIVLLFLCSAVFVAIGVSMIRSQANMTGYLVAGFFTLGIVVSIWRLVRPAWLELSPAGLRWFTGVKIEKYDWADFLEFGTFAPTTFSRHVVFALAANSPKRQRGTVMSQALAGADGGFGGGWVLSAGDLADLLNRAREKWSPMLKVRSEVS